MFKSPASGGAALAGLETKLSGGAPDDPSLPVTMRRAVRFMLAGAAISVVLCLYEVIATLASKNSITVNGKPPTSSEVTTAVLFIVVYYLIFTLLWLVMARFNRSGMTWARIVASILFAISTFELFNMVDSLHGGQVLTAANILVIILTAASWLVGLGAIAMLWRSDSTAFYRAQTIRRH